MNCDKEIVSDISYGKYIGLLIYIHVILIVTALPFVLALAGGRWFIAAIALSIFVLLTFPPAVWLHARNARVSR